MGARWLHLSYLIIMSLLGLWWTSDSDEPVTPSWWGYTLLLLGAANGQFRFVDPVTFSWLLITIACIGYWHYVLSVVVEIGDFLGIHVLAIKKVAA
eukprot:gene32531-17246_t